MVDGCRCWRDFLLQAAACRALRVLGRVGYYPGGIPLTGADAHGANAVSCVLAALRMHGKVLEVAEHGCGALRTLSYRLRTTNTAIDAVVWAETLCASDSG
jgi:hypothetical protein